MSFARTLVIDGQVLQSDARDRGMGRYTEHLIKSLSRQGSYKTIIIVLNKNIKLEIAHKNRLEDSLKGLQISYLDLWTTDLVSLETARAHNKHRIRDYLSNLTHKRIEYLIPSPFQEPIVSVFPEGVKKAVIFYDLIPFLYPRQYKKVMNYENYLKRFNLLFESDVICTISKSVADDLSVHLGVPASRIKVIDGAPVRSSRRSARPKSLGVNNRYILMPTSDDPRKNNLRAVLAFEEFQKEQSQNNLKLVITSKIHHRERSILSSFSDNLVFTGNVPDVELNWLYKNAEAVLFIPESEGLGLPLLESIEYEKPVVCSDIPVFKEISQKTFHFCDYRDHDSIIAALRASLGAKKVSDHKK